MRAPSSRRARSLIGPTATPLRSVLRTPISKGDETQLASPCNIWAKALGDVKTLAKVKAGTKIKVTAAD
jgi:hypothetical protein